MFRTYLFTKILSIIVFSCLFAETAFPAFIQKDGARPLGLGGAFVARADDASAGMWNPAGLAQIKQPELTLSYSALYTGLGDEHLGRGFLSYASSVGRGSSFGINLLRLQSPLYRETTVALSYSAKFGHAYAGISAKGLFASIVSNEYTQIDPLFQTNNLMTSSLGIDVGFLYKVKDVFSFGIVAQNINQPNIAFSENEGNSSQLPLELRIGIAYKISHIQPSFDVTFRNRDLGGANDLNAHLGVEIFPLAEGVSIRIGGNRYELATGASYVFKKVGDLGKDLQLDYTLRYPMPFRQNSIVETWGSHQLSITLRM